MDFITKQSKLTKEEWATIEVPCHENEKRILALISDGYTDVNISRNYTISLVQYMKLANPEQFDEYIYINYFQEKLVALYKKYDITPPLEVNKKKTKLLMKKADLIRMENTQKHIEEQKTGIFEYMLLELFE